VRGIIKNAVALGAIAVLTAACSSGGSSRSSSPSSSPRPSSSLKSPSGSASVSGTFKACLVTDTGGIGDRSVNASSWQGVQEAVAAEPGKITGTYRQSTSAGEYTPNIDTFLSEKCGIIITVGFLMGDNTEAAATANRKQKFAIVDYTYDPPVANIDALLFNTAQDAFLGGYLAAGMTKTGKVATYGGEKLATVTVYMDGFWDGVQYYNSQHHTHVAVLGWNERTQDGSFTGNFTSQAAGQALTQTFISEGADIIFPVADNVGLGTAKAVQDADATAGSDKVNMLWSGTDGCLSAPQYCRYFISSVTQGIQAAVKNAVLSAANGTFKGGDYVGDLANNGVALSPYHDFASKVSASLRAEILEVKAAIENGTIKPATLSPV
jgi:basic membrane protein A and related proteins